MEFKTFWKKLSLTEMIEDESSGEETYREVAETFESMADDEAEHKRKLEEMKEKKQVEKPGPSIHSAKWDRCVADLKDKKGVNAYAVCTAQLGEESFKSEMTKSEVELAKKELKKAIDTMAAGGVPKSLLAEQDLEGETKKAMTDQVIDYKGFKIEIYINKQTGEKGYLAAGQHFYSLQDAKREIDSFVEERKKYTKSEDKAYVIEIEYRCKEDKEWKKTSYSVKSRSDDEAKQMAVQMFDNEFNYTKNPNSPVDVPVFSAKYFIRSEGVNIKKSMVDSSGKKIETIEEKAKEADSIEEKQDLVSKLKDIQEKRQKSEIDSRKNNNMASFKNNWFKNHE